MIWALAGLGAGGPYSTYNAEYTPAQKDSPVVVVEEQAGFPWALAGLVAIGLGVAYASYKKDEFEPNKKGHVRRKVAPWAKGRVYVAFSNWKHKGAKGDEKKVYGALKSVGATKAGVTRRRKVGSSRAFWNVFGYVKKSELKSLRSKLPKRLRKSMRMP